MSNPNFQPPTTQTPTEIYYPASDGKPLAETDLHRDEIADLIFTLDNHFAARADTYVTGNIMFYYAEGNPQKFVSPDVMVCFGVGKAKRRVYKLWQERVPSVVFEISSRKTWGEDLNKNGNSTRLSASRSITFTTPNTIICPCRLSLTN